MKNHFMIDIETTGVDKKNDDILEVGIVEIEFRGGSWHPVADREFQAIVHTNREPSNNFAREHMSALYKECNEASTSHNYDWLSAEIKNFIHASDYKDQPYNTPKLFMGWNASNFDVAFLIEKGILTASHYEDQEDGGEILKGDAHYRVYEQTGALQLACDASGLSRKAVQAIAQELDPVGIDLPKGKIHDALYDCYWQIKMMNGLIAFTKNWVR